MGYASAGQVIFNPVMRALIEANASEDLIAHIASVLIDALRDADWDTEDESLEEFKNYPEIVATFALKGVHLPMDVETVQDLIDYLRAYPPGAKVYDIDGMSIVENG
jgi:hypothetical protein